MRQSIRCVWAHATVNLDLELYGVCGEARGLCVISESIWAEVFTLFGAYERRSKNRPQSAA
jgi:hypothetical protein